MNLVTQYSKIQIPQCVAPFYRLKSCGYLLRTTKKPNDDMKKPEIFRQPVRIRAVAQISRFIATACAAIAVCFALNAHAVNILVNPGFDATPGFSGWSAHTTESWSYATHTDVPLSAPNYLWQQGLYGNGGAPNTGYVSYAIRLFPLPRVQAILRMLISPSMSGFLAPPVK